MRNTRHEGKLVSIFALVALALSAGCSDWAVTEQGPAESPATQTARWLDEARVCASEWVSEASQNVRTLKTWQGASVGEPTAYTGSGGQASVLVFPLIKDQEEVGYVTLNPPSSGCSILEGGPGPPPSRNLPEARAMAAESLGTSADDLDVRLIHLEPMTYLVEFRGADGKEITFNLQSLREFLESSE